MLRLESKFADFADMDAAVQGCAANLIAAWKPRPVGHGKTQEEIR